MKLVPSCIYTYEATYIQNSVHVLSIGGTEGQCCCGADTSSVGIDLSDMFDVECMPCCNYDEIEC